MFYNTGMKRLFVNDFMLPVLDQHQKHYLKNVLRFKEGQELLVFDGVQEAHAIWSEKRGLIIGEIVRIYKKIEKNHGIAIAPIKTNAFEWMLEKIVEIGVNDIFLLKTQRANHKINLQRARNILIAAAQQSNRIDLPILHEPVMLQDFVKTLDDSWCYGSLLSDAQISDHRNIIIGPEGGWNAIEESILKKYCKGVFLSKNTLRSETAAIVGLSTMIINSY